MMDTFKFKAKVFMIYQCNAMQRLPVPACASLSQPEPAGFPTFNYSILL